jgi:hypothetical protein
LINQLNIFEEGGIPPVPSASTAPKSDAVM